MNFNDIIHGNDRPVLADQDSPHGVDTADLQGSGFIPAACFFLIFNKVCNSYFRLLPDLAGDPLKLIVEFRQFAFAQFDPLIGQPGSFPDRVILTGQSRKR